MENSKNKSKMKKYIIMGICTMLVVLTSIVWYLKFQKASDEDKDETMQCHILLENSISIE